MKDLDLNQNILNKVNKSLENNKLNSQYPIICELGTLVYCWVMDIDRHVGLTRPKTH